MTDSFDYSSLKWGLKRLALWGEVDRAENGDPHVAYEAKANAKTTLRELAFGIEQGWYDD